jgi:integrase
MVEIERKIARGGLTDEQVGELWDSLYLTADELPDFLEHVRRTARHPWIHPMCCMAAHAGTRRSEMIRAKVGDVDFEAGIVTIREKKRVRGRQTTRRVPLSPFLTDVLVGWLAAHPGGPHLFCRGPTSPGAARNERADRP